MATRAHSPAGLGTAAVVLLWIGAGLHLLRLATLSAVRDLGEVVARGGQPDAATAVLGLVGILFAVVSALLFITTAVVFLAWIYRAFKNLRALEMTFVSGTTPAMAIGGFFIPFVNLVHGYSAMQELLMFVRAGGPDAAESTSPRVSSSIVGWWWGSYLLANVSAFASALGAGVWTEAVGLGLLIVAALLLARMVGEVSAWQARRVASLAAPPGQGASGGMSSRARTGG